MSPPPLKLLPPIVNATRSRCFRCNLKSSRRCHNSSCPLLERGGPIPICKNHSYIIAICTTCSSSLTPSATYDLSTSRKRTCDESSSVLDNPDTLPKVSRLAVANCESNSDSFFITGPKCEVELIETDILTQGIETVPLEPDDESGQECESVPGVPHQIKPGESIQLWAEDLESINRFMNVCHICDKKFTTLDGLNLHIKRVHQKKDQGEYKCDKCDFVSHYAYQLKSHNKNKHLGRSQM